MQKEKNMQVFALTAGDRRRGMALAALLVLAGCASGPAPIEVTRFHLGQPIPADTILLMQAPGAPMGALQFQTQANALTPDLAAAGLRRSDAPEAAYIGVVSITQQSSAGPVKPPPFSIGIGGGSFGGGGGIGGGVAVPIGKARRTFVTTTILELRIRRRSDSSAIWEGRAIDERRSDGEASNPGGVLPALSRALLANFPGVSGQTVKVKPQ